MPQVFANTHAESNFKLTVQRWCRCGPEEKLCNNVNITVSGAPISRHILLCLLGGVLLRQARSLRAAARRLPWLLVGGSASPVPTPGRRLQENWPGGRPATVGSVQERAGMLSPTQPPLLSHEQPHLCSPHLGEMGWASRGPPAAADPAPARHHLPESRAKCQVLKSGLRTGLQVSHCLLADSQGGCKSPRPFTTTIISRSSERVPGSLYPGGQSAAPRPGTHSHDGCFTPKQPKCWMWKGGRLEQTLRCWMFQDEPRVCNIEIDIGMNTEEDSVCLPLYTYVLLFVCKNASLHLLALSTERA